MLESLFGILLVVYLHDVQFVLKKLNCYKKALKVSFKYPGSMIVFYVGWLEK